MKKIIIPALTIMLVLNNSCEESKQVDEDSSLEHTTEFKINEIPEGDLEILEIEGCEYIVYQDARNSNLGFGYMAHKGNCKNPIHIYRDTTQTKNHSKEWPSDKNNTEEN